MRDDLVRKGPIKHHQFVKNEIMEPIQSSSTSSQVQIIPNPVQNFDNFNPDSILRRILQGINIYMNSQKSLYNIENQTKMFTPLEFMPANKSDCYRLEKNCIPMINSMLNEYFEPYNLMNPSEKALIIKNFTTKYSFLFRCYQTSKFFPHPNDNRFFTHYGYYLTNDIFVLECFSDEVKQNKDECIRLTESMWQITKYTINKMLKQDFREVDLAALVYIIFAQECQRHKLYSQLIERNKSQLFEEFHQDIVNTFGFDRAGIKFANVLTLLNDTLEIQKQIYETRIIGNVFTKESIDLWDNLLPRNVVENSSPNDQSTENEH
uniref:NR LBD domain-containing protein n=1 Tax=Acrobeloides nanus TaxID=290746 RepID=A0A914EB43_9BILA